MYDSELIKICEAYNSIVNRKNDTINKEKFDDEMDSINPAAIERDEKVLDDIVADKEFDKKQYEVLKSAIDRYNLKFKDDGDIVCIKPFRPMSLDKFCESVRHVITDEAHDVVYDSIPVVGDEAEYMFSYQFNEFVKDISNGYNIDGALYRNTAMLRLHYNENSGHIIVVDMGGEYVVSYPKHFIYDTTLNIITKDIIKAYPFLAPYADNTNGYIRFILPTQINERIKTCMRKHSETAQWYNDDYVRKENADTKKRSEENMMWKQYDIEQGIECDSAEPKNIRPPKITVR